MRAHTQDLTVAHNDSTTSLAETGFYYHCQGMIAQAKAMYTKVLEHNPEDFNARHLLGVACMQEGRTIAAIHHISKALPRASTNFHLASINLGLCLLELARMNGIKFSHFPCVQEDPSILLLGLDALPCVRDDGPLVSVILPIYNHADFIERALRSVFRQQYKNIEILAIDDGSTDNSAEIAISTLQESPFPFEFVTNRNTGAVATLNQGISLAQGKYITFLNSDDEYHPQRIAAMVSLLRFTGSLWGFSNVAFIDGSDEELHDGMSEYIDELKFEWNHLRRYKRALSALLFFNPTISTGNIVLDRSLLQQLGGFRNYRYNHDWELCLRAAMVEEPSILTHRLYRYRWHGNNTIAESRQNARKEADAMLRCFLDVNCFSSTIANLPCSLLWNLLQRRGGNVFSRRMLQGIAAKQLRSTCRCSSKPSP